jgi:hypothetical protein
LPAIRVGRVIDRTTIITVVDLRYNHLRPTADLVRPIDRPWRATGLNHWDIYLPARAIIGDVSGAVGDLVRSTGVELLYECGLKQVEH